MLRKVIIAVINAEKAAYQAKVFVEKRRNTMDAMIKDMYIEHMKEINKMVPLLLQVFRTMGKLVVFGNFSWNFHFPQWNCEIVFKANPVNRIEKGITSSVYIRKCSCVNVIRVYMHVWVDVWGGMQPEFFRRTPEISTFRKEVRHHIFQIRVALKLWISGQDVWEAFLSFME